MRLRKFPAGGLAAVVLIVLLEVWCFQTTEPLTGLPYFEPTADDAVVVAKRNLFPRAAGALALVGDSSCTMGLDPAVLSGKAGIRAVNLGLMANFSFPGFAVIVEELLEQPVPPEGVALIFLPHTLTISEPMTRQYDILGRYLIAYNRSLPQYPLHQADWRSWFARKHRYNRLAPELGGSITALKQRMEDSLGFFTETSTYHGARQVWDHFEASSYAIQGIRMIAQATKARHVPFMIWLSPAPSDAITDAYRHDAYQVLLDLQRECPWVQIPQAEVPVWEPKYFTTVTHVNRKAAQVNSRQFAEAYQAARLRESSQASLRTR
jgi:hypothetical protein